MKRFFYYLSVLLVPVLTSCGSRKHLIARVELPPVEADSSLSAGDSRGLPDALRPYFAFDQGSLKPVKRPQKYRPAKPAAKPQEVKTDPDRYTVKRGTRITTRTVDVSAVYDCVKRVKIYDVTHRDVPEAFEGFKLAFVADLHYESLLKADGLRQLSRLLTAQHADALLMGGDYHEGCEFVAPVMAAMGRVKTPHGTFAVMGNNDYEACYDVIVAEMKRQGMHLLEHRVDSICKDGQRILIAGIRNPFDLATNGVSPTLALNPNDFVVMLSHTPDYAEDVSIANTDLFLAGHTHGGQVTLFGLYAPVVPSRYGQRFLSGLKYNSHHVPMIITNGIGTSKKAVRMFAPAEVVMIVLHRLKDN